MKQTPILAAPNGICGIHIPFIIVTFISTQDIIFMAQRSRIEGSKKNKLKVVIHSLLCHNASAVSPSRDRGDHAMHKQCRTSACSTRSRLWLHCSLWQYVVCIFHSSLVDLESNPSYDKSSVAEADSFPGLLGSVAAKQRNENKELAE